MYIDDRKRVIGAGAAGLIVTTGAAGAPDPWAAASVSSSAAAAALDLARPLLDRLDDRLAAIVLEQRGQAAAFTDRVVHNSSASSIVAGAVFVTVDAIAGDHDGAALLVQMQALGLIDGGSFGAAASGRIAIDKLSALLDLPQLAHAAESAAFTNVGLVTSQADTAMTAVTARSTYSVDGTGVRVGVLSDSFAQVANPTTTQIQDIANNDLPSDTQVLGDFAGGKDEGRAMAQLIHDIAPGASIRFATAFTGMANFAANIVALADAGSKIIVDDVGYSFDPTFQNGVIAQAINQVTARGIAYFSAAGNSGVGGYEGVWRTGSTLTVNGQTETLMRFADGQDYIQLLHPNGGSITLHWDQPAASAGSVSNAINLDLLITDQAGTILYRAAMANEVGGDPVTALSLPADTTPYYVRVGVAPGSSAPGRIKLVPSDPQTRVASVTSNLNTGTLSGHEGAEGNSAVAAIGFTATPAYGAATSQQQLESFSSGGALTKLFADNGTRLTTPVLMDGPAFTGVDGVNTSFFGADDGSDTDSFPNFYGTSATAPNVAAVAALMLSADASLTRDDLVALLKDSALDLDDPATSGFQTGYDTRTGFGLIQADKAVGFAVSRAITNDGQAVLTGTHLADVITGSPLANTLSGGGGADIITGGGGNDVIDGGAGSDVAVYSGPRASYTVTLNANGTTTVADNRAGAPDGVDTVSNVETLRFSDGDSNPQTILVGTEAQLNQAIATVDEAGASGAYVIQLTADIKLGTDLNSSSVYAGQTISNPAELFAINLHNGATLTIDGQGHKIDGSSANGQFNYYRGLFVYSGQVLVQNLTIANTKALAERASTAAAAARVWAAGCSWPTTRRTARPPAR